MVAFTRRFSWGGAAVFDFWIFAESFVLQLYFDVKII
jgi:hypothetical protein